MHSSSVEGRKLEEVKSDIRIASVGEITENGEPYRWIEIAGKTRRETTLDAPEGETHVIVRRPVYKLLIPEKHVGKGRMPLDHVIRGWIRRSEKSRPQKTGSLDRNSRRPLCLILSNPLKDVSALTGRGMIWPPFGRPSTSCDPGRIRWSSFPKVTCTTSTTAFCHFAKARLPSRYPPRDGQDGPSSSCLV